MDSNLKNFIQGRLGPVALGHQQSEVRRILGEPTDWLGKPPSIGPQVRSPENGAIWFYFNGACGIEFDQQDRVLSLNVWVEQINSDAPPFLSWPGLPDWSLGGLRRWLLAEKISCEMLPDENHLIVDQRCLVTRLLLCPSEQPFAGQRIQNILSCSYPEDARQWALTGRPPLNRKLEIAEPFDRTKEDEE